MTWILIAAALQGAHAAGADDQPKERSMLDRLMKFYSWNDPKAPKTGYQEKKFRTAGEFSDKKFTTGAYAETKQFSSKSFETKSYSDSHKSWLGKLFSPKELPQNLQGANRDASKKFETGTFASRESDYARKGDPYAGQATYVTREVSLKGKTQGAIDNDPKLQEAIRKGLSIDDVKRLLNKPGSSSN